MSNDKYQCCDKKSTCDIIYELFELAKKVHLEIISLIVSKYPDPKTEIKILTKLDKMLYLLTDNKIECDSYFLCGGDNELLSIREGLATTLKTLRLIFNDKDCKDIYSLLLLRVLSSFCREVLSNLALLNLTCCEDKYNKCYYKKGCSNNYRQEANPEYCEVLLRALARAENARRLIESLVENFDICKDNYIPHEIAMIIAEDYQVVASETQYVLSQLDRCDGECPLILIRSNLITANRFSRLIAELFRADNSKLRNCEYLNDITALLILSFSIESDIIIAYRALGCDCLRECCSSEWR